MYKIVHTLYECTSYIPIILHFLELHLFIVLSNKSERTTTSRIYTDKKEKEIFLICKKFRWDMLQSHIWGRASYYEELTIYEGQLIPSKFPYTVYEENFIFAFISVQNHRYVLVNTQLPIQFIAINCTLNTIKRWIIMYRRVRERKKYT